jgi:hypothetical protein
MTAKKVAHPIRLWPLIPLKTTLIHFFPLLHTIGTPNAQCKRHGACRSGKTSFQDNQLRESKEDAAKVTEKKLPQINYLQNKAKMTSEV